VGVDYTHYTENAQVLNIDVLAARIPPVICVTRC
jgi:hypothetical protein